MWIRFPRLSETGVFVLRVLLVAALPGAFLAAAIAGAYADRSGTSARGGDLGVVILLNSVEEKIMDHAISYSLNLGRAFRRERKEAEDRSGRERRRNKAVAR